MGLNLETLIGILVILILLILADGVRRMIRERHGRLRMRIDRRFRGQGGAEDEERQDYPTELVSRPRVRGRAEDPLEDDEDLPPIRHQVDDEPPAPPGGEQQTLFGAEEPEPPVTEAEAGGEPEPEPEAGEEEESRSVDRSHRDRSHRERATRGAAEPAAQQPVLEVIVFHLIARRPDRFDGKAMLSLMLESGLRYGDMNIFHRHRDVRGDEELQFSVANAVEPGTFDIDTMEEQEFAGITFFLKLPGPHEALGALDRMLAIGKRMAEELDGELKDEQHSVLTPQTMEHLRQRVQEFERRQRVSSGV